MYPAPTISAPEARRSTWWWFLVPALSLGFGTFVMVFRGGRLLKARPHLLAAAGYLLTDVAYFCTAALNAPADDADPNAAPSHAVSVALVPFLVIAWVLGTLHTIYLQQLVAKLPPETYAPIEPEVAPHPAAVAAARRAALRAQARYVVRSDPAEAWELRIGRPDVAGRRYDDGGLVDVNHVPADWIAYALQIPREWADEIVAARDRNHGFRTAEELAVHCKGMAPDRLAVIKDFLLFGPM